MYDTLIDHVIRHGNLLIKCFIEVIPRRRADIASMAYRESALSTIIKQLINTALKSHGSSEDACCQYSHRTATDIWCARGLSAGNKRSQAH